MNSNKFIWDLFTFKEEYKADIKDIFDRPLIHYTHRGLMSEPYVSSYLLEEGFKPDYPDNKKFAVCISHDIDLLYAKSKKKKILVELLKCNIKNLSKELKRNFLREIDPELNIKNVYKVNQDFNIKSTYFFLSINNKNHVDFNYSLQEIENYFKLLKDSGNEIGLHGSRNAFNNEGALINELVFNS